MALAKPNFTCFKSTRKAAERERQNLTTNRDQELAHQRTMENERHKLELENSELNRKVSERNALLEAVENSKREISVLQGRVKVRPNTFE